MRIPECDVTYTVLFVYYLRLPVPFEFGLRKIYTRQETHNEMRIPERGVTYTVLSVYLLTFTSPIRHKMDHI